MVTFDQEGVAKEREVGYEDLKQAEMNSFGGNYAVLVEGLAKLPKVKTLRYWGSTTTIGPGTLWCHRFEH